MDHKYIDELDIVDRYLMGKLPVDESARFEEHFVDCSDCTDRLETTKAFVEGLRLVASERAPEARINIPKGRFWYLRSRKAFALAAGVLSLVVLASAVLVFNQIRRSRAEADQARSVSAQWERRYEEEHQAASSVDAKHQETERELTRQLNQLQAEIEKQERTGIAHQYDGSKQPQINPLIFDLVSARGGESSSASTNELIIPRSPTSFSITVALEEEGSYKDYRMTILGDHGQLIWKGSGFKPNRYNALSAGFNSTLFRDGDYLLTVEGVAGDGNASVLGKYSFRVVKTP